MASFLFSSYAQSFCRTANIGLFLATVWAILIVGLACVDEVKHRLPAGDAVLYLGGLVGVCAIDYIIFSVTTLYYIGYLLLVAYIWLPYGLICFLINKDRGCRKNMYLCTRYEKNSIL